MAKQKGILKVQGSIGGLTFYQQNGKDLIRTSNGPSKDKIRNAPNFKRTRENNQEFAGATQAGKGIRMGLIQAYKGSSDSTFTSRLVKVCRQVLAKAEGVRGQRPFLPADFKEDLLGIVFDSRISFDSILMAPYFVTDINGNRNSIRIDIPDFNTGNMVNAPAGATHFRITGMIGVLSSYTFVTTTGKYEPTDSTLNSVSAFGSTDYLALGVDTGSTQSILLELEGSPVLPASSVLLCCIGIEFYQEMGSMYYKLQSGNAIKIAHVF